MLGPGFKRAPGNDPTAYRKVADPKYVAALKEQQEAKHKLTTRRRPILRLVWDRDRDGAT